MNMAIAFSRREQIMLIIAAFVSAFILTFDEWGIETYDFSAGLNNLLIGIVIAAVSLCIKLIVQKYSSGKFGNEAEFRPWVIGFIVGLFLIFITNGRFVFLAFGGLVFSAVEKLRIGKQEQSLSPNRVGWLSVLGPLTHIFLALLAKILFSIPVFSTSLLAKIISINIWFAVYSIIPIPFVHKFKIGGEKEFGTSDGLKMLFAAPLQYAIITTLIIMNIIVISLSTALNATVMAVISFVIILLVYHLLYKQHLKRKSHNIYKYRFE